MKKKMMLLGAAIIVTLPNASTRAAEFHTPVEFQGATPNSLSNKALATTESGANCVSVDDLTAATGNAGEFCLVSGHNSSTTRSANFSVTTESPLQVPNTPLEEDAEFAKSVQSLEANAINDVECLSAGGSTAATENGGGFCLASDLSTSTIDFTSFAIANELPVTGIQFLQFTFGDGSTVIGSTPLPDASAGAECQSAGGSSAATEDDGGFCLASDLISSVIDAANFSVANGLPVVGLQFLQVTFFDGSQISNPSVDETIGAECVSIGGSSATTGGAGGFCFASDLSTSTTDFANFSFANELPVASLQFLQATFGDSSQIDNPVIAEPQDTECVSVGGSTASIGNTDRFCLASDRSTSTMSFANFSFANNIPVKGFQFLQIAFREDSPPLSVPPGAVMGKECISVDGSTAKIGNEDGFCLASDRSTSAMGTANFSVANDLPVAAMHFLQVPYRDGNPLRQSRRSLFSNAPMGVVLSDSDSLSLHYHHSPPAFTDIAGHQARFFRISNRRSGIKLNLGRQPHTHLGRQHRHRHSHLGHRRHRHRHFHLGRRRHRQHRLAFWLSR